MASTVDEIKRLAKEKLLRDENVAGVWDFIQIATGDRHTYDESLRAFKRWRFQPRILSARPSISMWTTVLGEPISMPVGIAPTVGSAALHGDAEATFGRAASRAKTLMVLSSVGDLPIETFVKKVPQDGLYWAQTYLFRDRRNTLHIVRNAERAGFKAIVVTVDSPVEHKSVGSKNGPTRRYLDILFRTPVANIRFMDGQEREFSKEGTTLAELWADGAACHKESFCFANWDELAWLKSQTKLAIVLKGVVSADSARQAASFGVAGILVSAHGGRQLDGVPAPLDVLPEIVHAVKDTNVEIYMDGGVRTGNDVLKALALGARAVFIGRPALYGLAYDEEEGVDQVLNILKEELSITMALCGCSTISEVDRSIVKHETEFHPKL